MKYAHTPGPWTLEREVYLSHLGVDPDRGCSEVHHNGFTIGYWVPTEWDGHCPDADLIARAPTLHESLKELVEICRFKCSPHDEVILESGRTNHQALLDAVAVLESLEPPKGCTCDDPVTGAVPNYCRLHDGDYSSWLVSNNID